MKSIGSPSRSPRRRKLSAPTRHPLEAAQWIWPGLANYRLHNAYALFRKDLQLTSIPKSASVWVTADACYQLFINGRYVCGGPARGFHGSWPFDQVDITAFLRKGTNYLAARVHHPGCGTFTYISKDTASFLFALHADELKLNSDTSWWCRRQFGVLRDTAPLSAQLSFQEHIDLRREPPEWTTQPPADSLWEHPSDPRAWNAMPWGGLEERGIPLLDEQKFFTGEVIGLASGPSKVTQTDDVARLRFEESLQHKACAALALPVTAKPARGAAWQSFLVDFGHTVVGRPLLTTSGAKGGEIVDLTFYETLAADSLTPDFKRDSVSKIAMGCRAILRPGKTAHQFFHPIGFRYAIMTVRAFSSPLTLNLQIRSALYPLAIEGRFHCSDDGLNRIWQACAWTQQVCSMDSFVDTPWREQAQWWGDARVQAWNTFQLTTDTRLFRRGLRCIARQTLPNGLTYGLAPTKAHSCILPDFSLFWILTLWDFYWQTGEIEPFLTHRSIVEGILRYFEDQTDPETGLIAHDPRYWLFLDWADIPKTGFPAILSLWYLDTCEKLIVLFEKAGDPASIGRLRKKANALRRSLSRLVNSQGLLRDGYTIDHKPLQTTSIHAQTLAIIAKLEGVNSDRILRRVLQPYLQGKKTNGATPSSYWVTYVLGVMAEAGHAPIALDFIRKRWAPMADYGTTWETFTPDRANESFSHAWSAHPLFHIPRLLSGISQTQPGWKAIRVKPHFCLPECEVVTPTPHGNVEMIWQTRDQEIQFSLVVPDGITVDIQLSVPVRQLSPHSWEARVSRVHFAEII